MTIETELASARAALIADALPETATIKRYTLAADGRGGETETWTGNDTTPCRVGYHGRFTEESALGGRMTVTTDAVHLTYPSTTFLHVRDRVIVGSKTYE